MSQILVAMFDTQTAATQAREQLLQAGFSPTAVSLTGGSAADAPTSSTTTANPSGDAHHEGGIAHFFANLFGNDDKPDAERTDYTDTYREAFQRGSCSVSVTFADDAEMDTAERILNDCGAIDIDERAQSWRQEGWTGGTAGTAGIADTAGSTFGSAAPTSLAATQSAGTLSPGETRKLQEVEEELKVGKRAVTRGGVRIFTRMTEVPVTETVRLREERPSVERTVVDRPATEADFAAFKEGSIEVRGMSEEAVVSKTARVTGEVEIGKSATEREETIRDTVRKTEVDVEQLEGDAVTSGSVTGGSAAGHSVAGVPAGGTSAADSTTGVGKGLTDRIDPATGKKIV